MVDELGLDVGNSGEADEVSVLMGDEGGACVGSAGVSERDCCKLLGVIRELWKELPCSFPFCNSFSIRLSLRLA